MKVGILGGGQLSRMLALAGIPLGLNFAFYDPNSVDPVKSLGDVYSDSYDNIDALQTFLADVDVITYENENIPIATLESLADQKLVRPCLSAIQMMQDRLLEKRCFNKLEIPTTQYIAIDSKQAVADGCDQFAFPMVLKQRKNGYDGKGQVVLKSKDDLAMLTEQQCQCAILEEFIHYDREVSVIGCRDSKGHLALYDLCENTHSNGILVRTKNRPDDFKLKEAGSYLANIMESLDYVGVCAFEFFDIGDRLVANELAPRVHNTGHWTIEGAVSSQFENHLRSILDWPLGATSNCGEFIMYNILGAMPDKLSLLAQNKLHLHDYGKTPRKGRKIGHVTIPKQANNDLSSQVEKLLGLEIK